MAREPTEKVEPAVCGCFQHRNKKGDIVEVCFRRDFWGALSQEQQNDPKICSIHHEIAPTMKQLQHYRDFTTAVELAAKDFKGSTVEEWRKAVGEAYKRKRYESTHTPKEVRPVGRNLPPPQEKVKEVTYRSERAKKYSGSERIRHPPRRAWRK